MFWNTLSKIVHDFWVYCVTSGEFQAFITDFRLLTKHGNSIKPNLSLHNTKVAFITCTILKTHQNYHGYLVMVNAKNCTTYDDLRYSCKFECTSVKFHYIVQVYVNVYLVNRNQQGITGTKSNIKESRQDPCMIDSHRPLVSSFHTTLSPMASWVL